MDNLNRGQQSNLEHRQKIEETSTESTPEKSNISLITKIKKKLEVAKERVFSLTEYTSLKVKEYFGKLNKEEFDKLLILDFQTQLEENPLIVGTFSPELELAKIRNLPKDKKREAIDTFKENLAVQREALARCRVFIERCIEFDHDVPREKLIGLVEIFGAQFGFTDEQKQIAEELIDSYFVNRQRALEFRKRFPDDIALVRELTNVEFDTNAKFVVSTGAMTIDITTDGLNAIRFFENSNGSVANAKLKYGGFAFQSHHEEPISFIVINTSNFYDGRLQARKTLLHEYEHQKNKLFRKVFEKQIDESEEKKILLQYNSEQNPELKRFFLEVYFRFLREDAFQLVKDEVIAMIKDGEANSFEQFFMKDNSPYDYLAYARDWEVKKDDPVWHEVAQRVLVDNYKAIIERSVSAFERLKKEGGYTVDETIAMLADRPLPEWTKTARRLLDQRKKIK